LPRALVLGSLVAFAVAAGSTALLVSVVLPAESTSARERPGAFVSRTVAQIVSDDYATAWDTLYPAHQAVAPKDEYVTCELQSPLGLKLGGVKVLRVASRLRRIPGDSERVPVELVTLRLTISSGAPGTKSAFSQTFTAVAEGDAWAWILTPSKYELYRSDACGTA
jgi:hypothetical protein